jgi:hypothetical protein
LPLIARGVVTVVRYPDGRVVAREVMPNGTISESRIDALPAPRPRDPRDAHNTAAPWWRDFVKDVE